MQFHGNYSSDFRISIPEKPFIFQIHKEVGERYVAYWCVRDSESKNIWIFHEVYMLCLVLIIPLTIMALCYTRICWEIWRVMKRRYHMTSRHTWVLNTIIFQLNQCHNISPNSIKQFFTKTHIKLNCWENCSSLYGTNCNGWKIDVADVFQNGSNFMPLKDINGFDRK